MNNGIRINLLPKEVRKKRKAEKGWYVLVLAEFLFIAVLIILSVAFGVKVNQEEIKLSELKNKTTLLDKQIAEYNLFKERKEEIAKHEAAIKKALDKQLFWHRFLNELSMVMPQDVTISNLSLTNDQISMSGAAWNHKGVAELLVRMSDLDELKDIWVDGSKDSELAETTILGQSNSSNSSPSAPSSGSSSSKTGVKAVEFTLTAKLKNPGPKIVTSSEGSSSSSKSTSSNKS